MTRSTVSQRRRDDAVVALLCCEGYDAADIREEMVFNPTALHLVRARRNVDAIIGALEIEVT